MAELMGVLDMNDAANIQAIRSERLKDLRTSKVISIKALADATGISVGSLNAWENDDATAGKTSTDGMKLENLIKLADFYGVSLDYLAGRTDIKSTSPTLQGVCEYTGLSEKNVNQLHEWIEVSKQKQDERIKFRYAPAQILKALNSFLGCFSSTILFQQMAAYMKHKRIELEQYGKINADKDDCRPRSMDDVVPPEERKITDSIDILERKGYQLLMPYQTVEYDFFQVSNTFTDILKHEILEVIINDGEH